MSMLPTSEVFKVTEKISKMHDRQIAAVSVIALVIALGFGIYFEHQNRTETQERLTLQSEKFVVSTEKMCAVAERSNIVAEKAVSAITENTKAIWRLQCLPAQSKQ